MDRYAHVHSDVPCLIWMGKDATKTLIVSNFTFDGGILPAFFRENPSDQMSMNDQTDSLIRDPEFQPTFNV
jgi:hypothetical protein